MPLCPMCHDRARGSRIHHPLCIPCERFRGHEKKNHNTLVPDGAGVKLARPSQGLSQVVLGTETCEGVARGTLELTVPRALYCLALRVKGDKASARAKAAEVLLSSRGRGPATLEAACNELAQAPNRWPGPDAFFARHLLANLMPIDPQGLPDPGVVGRGGRQTLGVAVLQAIRGVGARLEVNPVKGRKEVVRAFGGSPIVISDRATATSADCVFVVVHMTRDRTYLPWGMGSPSHLAQAVLWAKLYDKPNVTLVYLWRDRYLQREYALADPGLGAAWDYIRYALFCFAAGELCAAVR
jgi:hypothetical protein